MKIYFVDKNKKLVELVREVVKETPVVVRSYHGDIFKHKGVIVSASNPSFSMGGGLDALIARRYPKECKQVKKGVNQRVGNVIFTITVDNRLKASRSLVRKALRYAFKQTKSNETVLISGLGTGIGGLSVEDFAQIFKQTLLFSFRQGRKSPGKPRKDSKEKVFRWKFLREGLKSDTKGDQWKVGEWKHVNGEIKLCNNGLHCSQTILQALGYVKGEVLAQVEVSGKSDIEPDKEAYSDMRVVKAYNWEKKDSVALSIFAAEKCLKNFEDNYPDDKRPRKAIEAAKKWLKEPTDKNQSAARSAAWSARSAARSAGSAAESAAWSARSAAWSAESARSAAWSAAWSARSAAWSARSAARSAAWSAESARSAAESARSAAWSAGSAAESAAWSAARQKVIDQINEWLEDHVSSLTEIK